MTIQIATTQDVTPENLRSEPSFRSNVESSIAFGLGVSDEQVSVIKIDIVSRRLRADDEGFPARRLTNAALKVDYEVYMNGQAEKNRIKSSLEASMDSKGDFAKAFQKDLQAKEKASGRTVVVDSMKVAAVDVVDRTMSISEAKVDAQEKAASTTTSSTSTSQAPTTKTWTVTEPRAPATTEAMDYSVAGQASEIFPQLWMATMIILANCL